MTPQEVNSNSSSFNEMFVKMRELSSQHGNLPMSSVMSAYTRTVRNLRYSADPYVQNRRVKSIQTLPGNYTVDQVGKMITDPGANEQNLRQVHHALEGSAYPMLKIRKTYTDMMTFRWYAHPAYLEEKDAKDPTLFREWALIEKLNEKLKPAATAHEITGKALQEGKVFYTPQYQVDRAHNQCAYATLQQLPSDWVKIVGFNDVSKYTVAFNLFYLMQPGTDWRQFGTLLEPYLQDFNDVLIPTDAVDRAKRFRVDLKKVKENRATMRGRPEAYQENGKWAYWVTLPFDKVWTFEIDDTNANVVSPMTGLYLSMLQIAKYEQVQMELVQNPLVAVMTGEMPYHQEKEGRTIDDDYRLSPTAREYFETIWYDMLAANNTGGIAFFGAPFNNMKLHQLAEAPSSTEISSNGYKYAMLKSGVSGVLPIDENPRAGVVNFSGKLESRYCNSVYEQFMRMMGEIYDSLGLTYTWRFKMFGDIISDEKMETEVNKAMSSGILPDVFIFNALRGRTVLDDLSMSRAIDASDIMWLRQPLVSSYNMSSKEPQLPPDKKAAKRKKSPLEQNPGGRPGKPIEEVTSEGTEDGLDA